MDRGSDRAPRIERATTDRGGDLGARAALPSPTLLGLGTSAGELLGPTQKPPTDAGGSRYARPSGHPQRAHRALQDRRYQPHSPTQEPRAATRNHQEPPGATRSPAPGHQTPLQGHQRRRTAHSPAHQTTAARAQQRRQAAAGDGSGASKAPRRQQGATGSSGHERSATAAAGRSRPLPQTDLSPHPGRSPTGQVSSLRLHSSQPSHSSHNSQKRTRTPENQGTRPPF